MSSHEPESPNPDFPDSEPRLPDALARRLRELQHVPQVPAEVDARVLSQARTVLGSILERRQVVRWGMALAAAAAVAIAVVLPDFLNRANDDVTPVAVEDVDGSGTVDILDAFALARRLRDGNSTETWDFNGDGRVDADDVDHIASVVVR